MTGQGNKSFEQIQRAARVNAGAISLHKTYRTRNQSKVRALAYIYTTKTVINGRIVEAAHRQVIEGQAFVRVGNHFSWEKQIWELDGHHLLHDYMDLVEAPEQKPNQMQLI